MDSRKFLSDDEREHLEVFLRDRVDTDLRNAAMILTALHTGARAMELLALSWDEINVSNGEIFLATLKGGRPRPVVVPRFVREALARLKVESPARPFDISYSRMVEIWNLYRPARKPFKSLRHTFAMRAMVKSNNVHFVQRALGHRNINSTMIYLDYGYSTAEFKKMMRVR